MIPYEWIEQAEKRIEPHIHRTPLTVDSDLHGNRAVLYLKWENQQVTGSFKVRGALNKVLSLQDWEIRQGLVAASAGNHGQGVALAGRLVGAQVTIFASDHAVPAKIDAMRNLGAEVRLVAGGYGDAEATGIAYAQDSGAVWISPYNDSRVIAGQGTLALETLAELPSGEQHTWLVPVGGGGLISGIGAALKHLRPGAASLVGVQSDASAFMHGLFHHSSQAGIEELPSLADGLSGPVEAGAVTIPMVRHYVDDLILVSEKEIAEAISLAWQRYHERIEGSAAVCLAALISGKIDARRIVVIISGGNIQPELHQQLIQPATSG